MPTLLTQLQDQRRSRRAEARELQRTIERRGDGPTPEESARISALRDELTDLDSQIAAERQIQIQEGNSMSSAPNVVHQPLDIDDRFQSVIARALDDGKEPAWLQAAISGGPLAGAAAEVNAELGMPERDASGAVAVPLEAVRAARQLRAERVATTTSTVTGFTVESSGPYPRVYAADALPRIGIQPDYVEIGQARYNWFSAGPAADVQAEGQNPPAAVAFTAAPVDLLPKRVTAIAYLTTESLLSVDGLESAALMDMNDAVSSKIEQQVIAGTGASQQVSGLTKNAGTGAVDDAATYAQLAALAHSLVDGKFAIDRMGLQYLVSPAFYAHLAGTYLASGGESALDVLEQKTGGVVASAHMPAASSNVEKFVVTRMARRGSRAGFAFPKWNYLGLVRDDSSKLGASIGIAAVQYFNWQTAPAGADFISLQRIKTA